MVRIRRLREVSKQKALGAYALLALALAAPCAL